MITFRYSTIVPMDKLLTFLEKKRYSMHTYMHACAIKLWLRVLKYIILCIVCKQIFKYLYCAWISGQSLIKSKVVILEFLKEHTYPVCTEHALSLLQFRTCVVERSYSIKVPFPDALKKFFWVFVLDTVPSYNHHDNSTGMQYITVTWSMINSRQVSCWYCPYSSSQFMCEWEISQQFGHFDCNVVNCNRFALHFTSGEKLAAYIVWL